VQTWSDDRHIHLYISLPTHTTAGGFGAAAAAPAAAAGFGFGAKPAAAAAPATTGFGAAAAKPGGFATTFGAAAVATPAATAATTTATTAASGPASIAGCAEAIGNVNGYSKFSELSQQQQAAFAHMESFVRAQQHLRDEIGDHVKSGATAAQARRDAAAMRGESRTVAQLWSGVTRDLAAVKMFEASVRAELKQCETVTRNFARFASVGGVDGVGGGGGAQGRPQLPQTIYLPATFYWQKRDGFVERMGVISQQIDEVG
jgi:hypothetical protein